MKLVRYTVVDPDQRLAKERPDLCILGHGTWLLNGIDEKGLAMEISEHVGTLLTAHNEKRGTVSYETENGDTKQLRPIRIGQLDVVLETLKEYQ